MHSDVPDAKLCAWYLLEACFDGGMDRSRFFLRREEECGPAVKETYEAQTARAVGIYYRIYGIYGASL